MFSGFEWLLLDLASRFGKDKDTYNARIQWAEELLPLINVKTKSELKVNLEPWVATADDKPHFVGAALAIWDTIQNSASNWMVSQDSASSGAQLMSCMTKCHTGMSNTGVLGTDVPDLYTSVNDRMGEQGSTLPRKVLKKGMIPHMYASTVSPKRIFGESYNTFLKAYGETVPRAQILSDLLVDAWNSKATEHVVTAPDGFVAILPVLIQAHKIIPFKSHSYKYVYNTKGTKPKGKAKGTKALSANTTHIYDAYILRELNRRCNYSQTQVIAALEALTNPNLGKVDQCKAVKLKELEKLAKDFNQVSIVAVEYIDKNTAACVSESYRNQLVEILEQVLLSDSFEIKNVHDDFACLPNYVSHMKFMYNLLLKETYIGKWIYAVLEKLTGKAYPVSKVDMVIADQILNASYSIS
tara:strand:- start:1798 stop:3033 length:1236 start_codon:yes stop_codon:yes gene_type:complete